MSEVVEVESLILVFMNVSKEGIIKHMQQTHEGADDVSLNGGNDEPPIARKRDVRNCG